MDSGEELPNLSNELITECPLDFEEDPVQIDFGTVYYESTYQQLARDRDDLRQRYEREKRERESLETKYHYEFDQKVYFEEKLSELSRSLSKYEEELCTLRLENSHLKAQFGQLKSAIQTRMSSIAVGVTQIGKTGESSSGNGFSFIATSTDEVSSNGLYKQEVALLAQENELFKHIIDVIDKQDNSKVTIDEGVSGQSDERLRWFENEDVARLEREKAQLEDHVKELERSNLELERTLEDVRNKAEDNLRACKRESKVLESELYSQSTVVEDYEVQMSQMKQTYEGEIRQLELKLEMEVTSSKELQRQSQQLELSIRKLEEERKELLVKIEEAYKAENEIVEERTALEESYSRDFIELRRNFEEENQKKEEMSIELERLANELVECEKQKNEIEARFFHEAQELRIQLEKERDEIYSYLNSAAVTQVMQSNVTPANQLSGFFSSPSGTQTLMKDEEWKMKLTEEVRKKEKLEEENKKLLYQVNELLEQNRGNRVSNTTSVTEQRLDYDRNNKMSYSDNNEKVRDLEVEIEELKEHCRVLEKDAKKKKDLENKNIELCEEIEEITVKKAGVVKKQKELVKELDNSLSSVHQVEDKNRRLAEEVENLSRKMRQMEENFRSEKDDWMRNHTKEKTLQMNDLLSEKEAIERKYNEQMKLSRNLEAEKNSLETRIFDLEREKERIERKKSEITSNLTKEIHFERGRTKMIKDELDESVEIFKKKTEQLETTLYEKKKRYDEEIRVMEEEKQRIRADLENEKEAYRRRFEEERKIMEGRIIEIETKLRKQTTVSNDFVQSQVAGVIDYDAGSANVAINQSGLNSSNHQIVSDLKRQIETLRRENEALQDTIQDTERKHRREINDLEYDFEQKSRRIKNEIEEEFRRKIDDYERRVESMKGQASISQDISQVIGTVSDKRSHQDMSQLVIEHKEQMDGLRKQVKLQMDAFKVENQNLKKELQDERNNLKGHRKDEVTLLHNTIHKLTEELKKLKKERENLLSKLRREKGNCSKQIIDMNETVSKVREECEKRIREEKENAQRSINDLKKTLALTESRMRSIEEKYRKELHQQEVKFEYKKTELEQNTSDLEIRLKESLQMEYKIALEKEKEKFEGTLRVLRKEITSLQEQRKQIQTKITQRQSMQSSHSLRVDKKWSSNNASFHKSKADTEYRISISRETKHLENRIADLEREVEVLKKEKKDIKASYRQEKMQIQEEFERERDRVEEKNRKKIEDLKRRLHAATLQIQPFLLSSNELDSPSSTLRYAVDTTESLQGKAFSADTQGSALATQLSILKDRMEDIEVRQKRSMNSNTRKKTTVRFSSNLEGGQTTQSRLSGSRSLSMLDLSSSSQLRSGTFGKSRISHGLHSSGRINSEATENRSFLSQSQRNPYSSRQGVRARDDQFLTSQNYGYGGSSLTTLGRSASLSPRAPLFFHGRTLSGFDASRLMQSRHPFRGDQYFLPSVGILGGLSQTRAGILGGSFIGTRGLHAGFGLQSPVPAPAFYGQSGVSSMDRQLLHSSSLNDLYQQPKAQDQGTSSNTRVTQVSAEIKKSSDSSEEVIGCELGSMGSTAALSKVQCSEVQSSDMNVTSTHAVPAQQANSQLAANQGDQVECKINDEDTEPNEGAEDGFTDEKVRLAPVQVMSEDAIKARD